ncbi:MAG: alpha/beta fold hydrolase [Gammaproteobacteria bacterium]|nr:alpha/beta fold hydrolase [Gammaproteobacteria bacterium]
MYEAAMRHFASSGFESLAFDLPGYGRSHKNARGWTIPQCSENILQALDQLAIDRFHLLGGHLSASIAVEMALTAPKRIAHLALDGLLNLAEDEWRNLLHRFRGMSPMMDRNGAFRSFAFDMVVSTLQEWNPEFVLSDSTLPQVYDLLNDYLEMGLDPIRDFVEPQSDTTDDAYDLAGALSRLRVPTLVLSADSEPLRAGFQRSLDAIRGSDGHVFPGLHPLVSDRSGEYVEAIAAHFAKRGSRRYR